jgi:hypothetical protein
MASPWNSLQVATLAVAALTPVTVAGLGVFVARASRRLERIQWANQTVITRRLELFGEVAPKLNQLLCFATFVGGWKEITPVAAIGLKRQIDETMYANRVLFSSDLFEAYQAFMLTMFATYAATGADALLRAPIDSKWGDRRKLPWWADAMEGLFRTGEGGAMDEIQAAYERLSQRFRADLYVTHESVLLASQQ